MNSIKFFTWILFVVTGVTACTHSTPTSDTGKNSVLVTLPPTGKSIFVDVRTTGEWNNDGHADCSVNYPLDELGTKIETLKGYDRVFVVCRSGSRANTAKRMLEQSGIKEVENLGAWQNITCP